MLTLVVDGPYALLALNVPHPDSLVIGAGQQEGPVHGHRQTCHQISVIVERAGSDLFTGLPALQTNKSAYYIILYIINKIMVWVLAVMLKTCAHVGEAGFFFRNDSNICSRRVMYIYIYIFFIIFLWKAQYFFKILWKNRKFKRTTFIWNSLLWNKCLYCLC